MTRDLDTLLRAAVTTSPVDTDAVMRRARTIRRRRAATRAVAVVAVLAVAGTGLTLALDDPPIAPIIGTDPVEVDEALAPVLPAAVVDADVPLLRVDVDVDDVPVLPDLGTGPTDRDPVAQVAAVGPDGTWVALSGSDASTLHVGGPTPTTTHPVDGLVTLVAVLPQGDVLAAVADDGDAPVDRLVHVADGTARTVPLTARLEPPNTAWPVFVQDEEMLRIAVPMGTGGWQQLVVWTAADGVVDDAFVADVPAAEAVGWGRADELGDGGRRTRVGVTDGPVLEIGFSDRREQADARTWVDHVVGGRRVEAIGWGDGEHDLSVIGVVGPGLAAAAVPVRLPEADEGWSEIAEPLLSVDGALWLRTRDGGVLRIVPAGALPEGSPVVPGGSALPPADLGPTPARPGAGDGKVTVLGAGDVGAVPDVAVAGLPVHAARPDGCCWQPSAVAPDGTLALWAEPLGGDSRGMGVRVVTPAGAVEDVAIGSLYGGAEGPALAFDESGNLWALANRWWSHAGFPDLVVRRPGEASFTSLGHLPLADLLGSDAGRVAFHVEGDEVALVGWTTDPAGRQVLAGWIEVGRDGAAVRAEDRQAYALPGPSPAITSGTIRSHLRVGAVGDEREASLSGPFLGARMPAQVGHDTDYLGFPHRTDVVGGLVVANGYDEDEDTTTVLVSDRAGATAAVRVAGLAQPLAAADGSVWAVTIVDGVGEQFVQVLDAAWRSVS